MSTLSLVFVLATGGAVVGGTPEVPNPLPITRQVATVEAGKLIIPMPSNDSTGRPVKDTEVVENPDHGQLDLPAETMLIFNPEVDPVLGKNYFGRDQFTVRQTFQESDFIAVGDTDFVGFNPLSQDTIFEVNVLPRLMPVAGKWRPETQPRAGLWDNGTQSFVLCQGGHFELNASGHETWMLDCLRYPVAGAPKTPLIPLVYPGELVDQLALFDPNTGDLFEVVGPNPYFDTVPVVRIKNAIGRFPILGVWAPGEPPTLAFVASNGDIGSLDAFGAWQDWPQPINFWPGDHLVWPVKYPGDGHDLIALVEPRFGDLQTVSLSGQLGMISGPNFPPLFQLDFRRPFNGPQGPNVLNAHPATSADSATADAAIARPSPDAFVIYAVADTDGLELQTIKFGSGGPDPHPQTVQIKFPNDPATPPSLTAGLIARN